MGRCDNSLPARLDTSPQLPQEACVTTVTCEELERQGVESTGDNMDDTLGEVISLSLDLFNGEVTARKSIKVGTLSP